MSDLIAEFAAFHHDYHGISAGRRVMQTGVLRRLETRIAPTDLDARLLAEFLTDRIRDGAAPTTVRKELNAIRPFLRWMWQRKAISSDQLMELLDVPPPRGSQGSLPKPYNRKQLTRMRAEIEAQYPWADRERPGETPLETAAYFLERFRRGHSNWSRVQPYAKRLQLEAVIAFALYGGLRREEIYRLDLEEMSHENAYVVVRSARKNTEAEERVRAVPWVNPMREAVGRWLEFREALEVDHERPWLSLHQQHYRNGMCFKRFSGLLTRLGHGWEFHRLRHTFATERLRRGMELENLSKILGHSSLQQTLAYAKIVEGDVIRSSERTEAEFLEAVGP